MLFFVNLYLVEFFLLSLLSNILKKYAVVSWPVLFHQYRSLTGDISPQDAETSIF